MADQPSARTSPVVTDERLRNALRLQLDRAINVERTTTRAQLAADSGINIHTVDAILSRDVAKHRRIKAEDMMSLVWALGEVAVNAVLATINYCGAEPIEPAGGDDMARVADAITEIGLITQAVARGGGHVGRSDKRDARAAADKAIRDLLPFSSAGHD